MGSRTRAVAGLLAAGMTALGLPALATTAAIVAAGVALAPAASAADSIAFRASTQVAFNAASSRVTIPAAVRETDGMLLFVTKNTAAASVTTPPAGWTLEGTRQSQHRHADPAVQQGGGSQRRRPERGHHVLGHREGDYDAARLRRHGRRPDRGLHVGSRDDQPRGAHDARRERGDRRLVGGLLLGGQVLGDHRLDAPGRPDAAQRSPSAPAPAGSPPWLPTPTPASASRPDPGAHRHRRRLHPPRRRCGPSCCKPDRDRRTPTWRRSRPSR